MKVILHGIIRSLVVIFLIMLSAGILSPSMGQVPVNHVAAPGGNRDSLGGSAMQVTVRNIPRGNPRMPGSYAMVYLDSEKSAFQTPTIQGIATFVHVPEGAYSLRVELPNLSAAFEKAVEYWGTLHDVRVGKDTQALEFERKMPFITQVKAFDGERFTGFSAMEAGKPLFIQVYVSNPSQMEVPLEVKLKLCNHALDSVIVLTQFLVAKPGQEQQVLLSYTPAVPGYYLYAPALQLIEPPGRYTDCWDWSEHPLFSVVKKHRMIDFSGFKWLVKTGFGPPGPNLWSDFAEHVWVDEAGELTLTLTPNGQQWLATEVVSEDFFAYGKYTFQLKSDPNTYDPHMVAAMFLYHDGENEIDIELTRWGDTLNTPVGNYVIQPSDIAGNHFVFPLQMQGTYSTHQFTWEPHRVVFESWHGHLPQPSHETLISRWVYEGESIHPEKKVRLHLNFWLFRGFQPLEKIQQEFKISRFLFAPWEVSRL